MARHDARNWHDCTKMIGLLCLVASALQHGKNKLLVKLPARYRCRMCCVISSYSCSPSRGDALNGTTTCQRGGASGESGDSPARVSLALPVGFSELILKNHLCGATWFKV